METLITVLITLMVVALTGAGINLVRLNRKADELDTLQMEVIDVQDRLERMIANLERDLRQQDEELHKDCLDRIDGWVRSTDRRFDKSYSDLQIAVTRLKTLDDIVNPNKDFLKTKKKNK